MSKTSDAAVANPDDAATDATAVTDAERSASAIPADHVPCKVTKLGAGLIHTGEMGELEDGSFGYRTFPRNAEIVIPQESAITLERPGLGRS